MLTTLTNENKDEILSNDLVVLDFWADWCGPCKMFLPVFEQVANVDGEVTFAKCNVSEVEDFAKEYGVVSVPTIVIIKNGVTVYNKAGIMPAPGFKSLITRAKECDAVENTLN